MANQIHISQARAILDARRPVSISVWLKSGEIREYKEVVSLGCNIYTGMRRLKFLRSGQIRTIRDACIFKINDCEVYI